MTSSGAITAPVTARRRARTLARSVGPPALAAGTGIGIWYLSSYLQFTDPRRRAIVQPLPHDVVRTGFLETRNLTEMLRALWETAQVALVGLALAISIGVLLAILMGLSRSVERTLFPYAIVLQTVPIVAITPLMIIWFGTGKLPRVIVCVIIAVFPIITNTLLGLKAAERAQHDLFTLHGAGRLTRLWKLELPASTPAMFTGFRISAGLSVIGAIVGEFFFKSGEEGIGRRISQYTNRNETDKLIAAIILTGALGLVLFLLFGWLGNRITRSWRPQAGASG
ncbi:MAG: ABC transporter permease [Actinomycetota bacterium]